MPEKGKFWIWLLIFPVLFTANYLFETFYLLTNSVLYDITTYKSNTSVPEVIKRLNGEELVKLKMLANVLQIALNMVSAFFLLSQVDHSRTYFRTLWIYFLLFIVLMLIISYFSWVFLSIIPRFGNVNLLALLRSPVLALIPAAITILVNIRKKRRSM